MREWVAKRVARWAGTSAEGGSLRAPTANLGIRIQEKDGSEVVLLPHGDSFDLISGKAEYYVVHISPKAMMKLAWFTIWTWWIKGTWFGFKLDAWNWAMSVAIEETMYRRLRADEQRKAASPRRVR